MRQKLKIFALFLSFVLFSKGFCLPADVQPITNAYYLPKVMELIEKAETSIYVVMYNMAWYDKYPDSSSNKLINLLCRAVKRNVSVNVILNRDSDKKKEEKDTNIEAAKILKRAGVNVMFDPLEQTTHAKLLIIDNRFVVIGSFNWSYYSLEKNNETAVLIDSKDIASYFLNYFNSIAVRSTQFKLSD